MRKFVSLAAASLLAVGLWGALAAAQGAPSVHIVSPADGATVSGQSIVFHAAVDNFKMDCLDIGHAPKPGQGHWHLYIDGKLAGLSCDSVLSVPNDAFPTITAGKHSFRVDLHNNDHTPVAGSQGQTITLNVANTMTYAPGPGSPAIHILSPANGATVGENVLVSAAIDGFKLAPVAIGQAPKAGEGHWHVLVDGQLADLSSSGVAEVHLTPGTHTIRVELHNNDHTPVAGAKSDQITVHVTSAAAGATLPKTGTPWTYPVAAGILILAGVGLAVSRRWHAA